jgi:thioredoxin-related protein
MKKYLFLTVLLITTTALFAQGVNRLNRAQTMTTKGFIDKKSTFNPVALDSLLKTDDYVILMASYEGCIPCEWLRNSDIFELYPISPYYVDFRLNSDNETIPYAFYIAAFPTCLFFDKSGEIVAVTVGARDYYDKLDKIVKEKERFSEHKIAGIPDEQILPFLNYSYKANVAYMKGEMEEMYKYATKAMHIASNFYSKYLLHKYYASKNDMTSANQYKALALEHTDNRETFVYKKLIQELKGEI